MEYLVKSRFQFMLKQKKIRNFITNVIREKRDKDWYTYMMTMKSYSDWNKVFFENKQKIDMYFSQKYPRLYNEILAPHDYKH